MLLETHEYLVFASTSCDHLVHPTLQDFFAHSVARWREDLLVKLTKGRLVEIGAKLLGMIVFAKLLLAALSREDIPDEQRRDFTLFVDEFQNFTSESVETMFAGMRKYWLNLVLANQNFGQLRENILESVLGNAGSLAFFRQGVKDVERIRPCVSPPFGREELLSFKNFVAAGRLLSQSIPLPPFVFETVKPS